MESIAILGSGMAGFGAAYRLQQEGMPSVTYDKNSYYGGHTASFKHDSGFIFDEGPHVSFTKHERLQKLFAENVDQKYEVIRSRPNNYWKGHWIKHPGDMQSVWFAHGSGGECSARFRSDAQNDATQDRSQLTPIG